MRKRRFIVLSLAVCILLPHVVSFSGARIVNFHARRDGRNVVLEWATENESNVDCYIIQKSTDTVHWTTLQEIKSKNSNSTTRQSYTFVDNQIYKNSLANFYYRLVIKDQDGSTTIHTVVASVSGSSGIKHTWGSIKAIFR